MSSTTEQATIQLAGKTPVSNSLLPMVMYDSAGEVIRVEVIVAQSPDAKTITISAPPIIIPLGKWEVRWELTVNTPGLVASFAKTGIILPATLPRGVARMEEFSSETLWTVVFENKVTSVNSFNYVIGIDSVTGTGNHKSKVHVTTFHDPTIAVVKDPVDPPPPG